MEDGLHDGAGPGTNAAMLKRKRKGREGDRHSGQKHLWVPAVWHAAMKALARRNLRTLAAEVLLAFQAHLEAGGLRPPPLPVSRRPGRKPNTRK